MPPESVSVGFAGYVFLALHLVLLPLGAWHSKRALDSGVDVGSRRALFASVAGQQVVLATFGLLAAWIEGIELFPAQAPDARGWIAAAVFVVLAAGTFHARWHGASPERRARLAKLMPGESRDLPAWFLVCVLAGFGEELCWRGVLYVLLQRVGLDPAVAIAAASAGFALAHATQGWRSMLLILGFAVGFHVIVEVSGNLYPAMAAHAAYDALAGVFALRLMRREPAAA